MWNKNNLTPAQQQFRQDIETTTPGFASPETAGRLWNQLQNQNYVSLTGQVKDADGHLLYVTWYGRGWSGWNRRVDFQYQRVFNKTHWNDEDTIIDTYDENGKPLTHDVSEIWVKYIAKKKMEEARLAQQDLDRWEEQRKNNHKST